MILPVVEYELIKRSNLIAKYLWSTVKEEISNKNRVVLRSGDCDCEENFDLLGSAASIQNETPEPILIEWHLAHSQPTPTPLTPLATLWRDLLKTPVIPYDPAERRRKLPEAFDQRGRYIAAHEQLDAEERQKKKDKEKAPFVPPEDEEADLSS